MRTSWRLVWNVFDGLLIFKLYWVSGSCNYSFWTNHLFAQDYLAASNTFLGRITPKFMMVFIAELARRILGFVGIVWDSVISLGKQWIVELTLLQKFTMLPWIDNYYPTLNGSSWMGYVVKLCGICSSGVKFLGEPILLPFEQLRAT